MAKQLFPVLKNFPPVLTQALAVPDGETSDCGLKMEVLKVGLRSQVEKDERVGTSLFATFQFICVV